MPAVINVKLVSSVTGRLGVAFAAGMFEFKLATGILFGKLQP